MSDFRITDWADPQEVDDGYKAISGQLNGGVKGALQYIGAILTAAKTAVAAARQESHEANARIIELEAENADLRALAMGRLKALETIRADGVYTQRNEIAFWTDGFCSNCECSVCKAASRQTQTPGIYYNFLSHEVGADIAPREGEL